MRVRHLGIRPAPQMLDELVVVRRVAAPRAARRSPSSCCRDALAELLAREPGEGDDEQLLERTGLVGDVAGDEGRERPRLAGASARLDERRARWAAVRGCRMPAVRRS